MRKTAIRIGALLLALLFGVGVLMIPTNAFTATRALLLERVEENVVSGTVTYANLYDIDQVNADDLRAAASAAISKNGKVFFNFCTLWGDEISSCVTVNPNLVPKDSSEDMNFMAYTSSDDITAVKASFEKMWSKKVAVIQCPQMDFGMYVVVRAKLDLDDMNTENLRAYSYDKEANQFKAIKNANCVVDDNGFLNLQTQKGGFIVIVEA